MEGVETNFIMKIRFSELAAYKLQLITKYLEYEWNVSVKENFVSKLNTTIKNIAVSPKMYPASMLDKNLRKCVLTKHTSIFYEIQKEAIFILTIIDNRQDPTKIYKELKELFG